MDDVLTELTAIEQAATALRDASRAEVADAYVQGDVTTFRARFNYEGLSVAPAGVVEQFEQQRREQYDEARRAEAADLQRRRRALEQQIEARIAEAEELPALSERYATAGDANRLLAAIAETLQRAEARHVLAGRTLAEVGRIYQQTPDEVGELPALIEALALDGRTAGIELRPDAGDAVALSTLQAAVRERRAARAHAWYAARERLANIGGPEFRTLLTFWRQPGYGVAVRRAS
jgi:hypothetical protein